MKQKRLLLILSFVLTLLLSSILVNAGALWGSLNETSKTNATNLWAYLKLAGYSDYAAAGICGNADQESSFNPTITGTHNGAFQMDGGQWTNLQSWASKEGLDYKDIVVQFKFIEGTALESDFKTYTNITLSEYKSCSDVVTGVEGFLVAYERCTGGSYLPQKVKNKSNPNKKYQDGDKRIQYAESCYTALVGTAPGDSSGGGNDETGGEGGEDDKETTGDSDKVVEGLIAKGYYTEDQLSAYKKLYELNIDQDYIDAAIRENLDQDTLTGLVNWERNVRSNAKEDGLIAKLRITTMWLGIMFTVWIMLVYLAYWFDRINSFFYIDMLSILTFGKLHISDTEDECTFHLSTLGKTDKKTVNHKTILCICLTGLLFASLIITGAFYKIIAGFVNLVLRLINKW